MMSVICLLACHDLHDDGGDVCYNSGMKVKVKLFASLRSFGLDEQVLELTALTTIDDVIHILRIPETIRLLRIVNGVHRPADTVLHDSDELALFPPIAGG
jgi:molybdopterin converting factor small subunit